MDNNSLSLSENAIRVLHKRYLAKNEKGEVIETAEEMFRRVARNIAQADKLYGKNKGTKETEEEFYKIMTNLEFLPNSPTLMNAGRDLQQLSACFVLEINDSMESIFETVKDTSMIHKSGGGTGFSFSRLRPKNSQVRSTGGVASGPVSFLKVFDAATQAVKQGGCVVPETRISTEYGIVKIKSLGPKHAKPNSWYCHNGRPFAVATDKGIEISDEFYNNGSSKVKKIETSNGYSIVATPKHRLRIINDNGNYVWRYIKDIKPGDWLVLQRDTYIAQDRYPLPKCGFNIHFNAKLIKTPQWPTKELGEFIGFFIGDGAMSINKRGTGRLIFTIHNQDKDTKEHLYKIAQELFDIVPFAQKKKQDKSTNYFFNSTVLVHWLKQIGVEKKNSLKANVPEIVFRAGRDFAYGFLRGLFNADGCISEEGYVSLSSVSKVLIKNIQLILLSLDIPSGISITKNRDKAYGKNPLYRLRIITQEGIEIFEKKIGFISNVKNRRLQANKDKAWEFNDVIPNQGSLLRTIYNGPGRGCGPARTKKGANRKLYRDLQHYLTDISAVRNLTRSRLKDLTGKHKEISKNSSIQWFLKNKQFYDKVTHIEEEEALTLDLSVPESNTYIANGFVSHNTRRGANMGILRIDHPDILEFITCKESDKAITNFNISVTVTEDFMRKVDMDEDYDLVDPHTKKAAGKLNAREVFDLIVKMAWKNGEPGIIFIDRMNKYNPTPALGEFESTNPCGEQNLLPYESCNLGSINLSKVVSGGEIDWNKLGRTVKTAVHFLDDVIDMNRFPLKKIEEITRANRKIGLGVMGFADMLIKLGIPYNSEDGVTIADKVMSFILTEARKASIKLAEARGLFPNFKDSIYDKPGGPKLRNATVTTIAPTGTLSIIGGCSSGVEPLFAIVYYKEVMDKERLPEVNEAFKEIAKKRGFWSERLLKKIAKAGSIQKLREVPDDIKRIFVTSHDIAPEWHIKIQAAFQRYTDNAVSKTINFAHEAGIDDVKKTYRLAHQLGCKGVTVYRDKSREEQVLNIEVKEAVKIEEKMAVSKIVPRPRPTVTYGTTTKIATGCGNLYVTINEDEEGLPFEVFMQMGKAGGCAMSQLEAIGRLLSLALRSGIEFNSIIEQLRGIRCPSPSWEKGGRIFSCSDAIARVVERRLVKTKKNRVSEKKTSISESTDMVLMAKKKTGNIVGVCPDCGGALWHIEGCMVCKACGYSKC